MAPTSNENAAPGLVSGRYRTTVSLGRGAHGEIWEAEDVLVGATVALKLLDRRASEPARVRREVAALRLLRLPGVVQLLDEGEWNGRAFIVMDRIVGRPFPGAAGARSWSSIAEVTLALCAIIARVHALGIVHRDLKPSNVLVTPEGRPVVLDFGVSTGAVQGDALTLEGQILGTPAYMAPEQIRGVEVGPSADLYALGVMIYEALSGRLPHEADSAQGYLFARLSHAPASLLEVASGVPRAIAAIVDRLLADDPHERPRSAGDLLAMLGERVPVGPSPRILPRLGGDEPVETIVAALRSRRSVDVVGLPGSGRSRCVREALARLADEGFEVIELPKASLPFASLEPVVGPLDSEGDEGLDAVRSSVAERLHAALRGKTLVVAEDTEGLDRLSRELLERHTQTGGVLRVLGPQEGAPRAPGPVVARVGLLPESALEPLFAGPDRIFHLREDAARLLWSRSLGLASRVAAEVDSWVRCGAARWDGDRLHVDREGLMSLALGFDADRLYGSTRSPTTVPARLADLWMWVSLAGPHASPRLLARATGTALFRIEADLEELVSFGALGRGREGAWIVRDVAPVAWSPTQRREAHRTLASLLPEGAPERLSHLVAGEGLLPRPDLGAIADEATALSFRMAQAGQLEHAATVLRETLGALRRQTHSPLGEAVRVQLLRGWLEIGLATATTRALDRLLYELARDPSPDPAIQWIEGLAKAALSGATSAGERALEVARELPASGDPVLERLRHGVVVLAARRCPLATEQEAVSAAMAWARGSADVAADAAAAGLLGRLRYREGRYEEAAEAHLSAARTEPWLGARIAARLGAASALMEAGRLEDALREASEAEGLAARARLPHYEARAQWLQRAAAYRRGDPLEPDLELVSLCSFVGRDELLACVCLNEGAVAFRCGERALAAELSRRAQHIWQGLGSTWSALLVRCLALSSAAPSPAGVAAEVAEIVRLARACPVAGIGIQALGLVAAWVDVAARPTSAELAALAERTRTPSRRGRLDILSVQESLDAMAAAWGAEDRRGRGLRPPRAGR